MSCCTICIPGCQHMAARGVYIAGREVSRLLQQVFTSEMYASRRKEQREVGIFQPEARKSQVQSRVSTTRQCIHRVSAKGSDLVPECVWKCLSSSRHQAVSLSAKGLELCPCCCRKCSTSSRHQATSLTRCACPLQCARWRPWALTRCRALSQRCSSSST